MIDGFFHADPHPGNVLVSLQTGEITFLDCGMIGELDVQQRINMIQLMIAIDQMDIPSMGQLLREMSVPFVDHPDDAGFFHDFERLMGRLAMSGGDFGQIISSATNLLSEHGLRLNPNLTMAIKALMQMSTIGNALYPKPGLMTQAIEMLKEMAIQAVTADKVIAEGRKQILSVGRELFKRIPTLTEATTKWLDQYQKGRFEVTLDTSQLSKEVDKVSGSRQSGDRRHHLRRHPDRFRDHTGRHRSLETRRELGHHHGSARHRRVFGGDGRWPADDLQAFLAMVPRSGSEWELTSRSQPFGP